LKAEPEQTPAEKEELSLPVESEPTPKTIPKETPKEETNTQALMNKMRSMEVVSDDDKSEESDSEDESTQKILEQMRQKIEQIHDEENDN
jgi:hypothetical protein